MTMPNLYNLFVLLGNPSMVIITNL